ncbi:MAG: isoleucine--tRNA ligase [Desulfurococcaceae archaeon]
MNKPTLSGAYSPHKVEDYILKLWEEREIYKLVKQSNMKHERFYNFIDGPPYPSGDIPHIGTAWNKSLKDAVLRYKRMKGYRVNDTPGYDCHGLPIEVKVEQKLGVKFKREIEENIGIDRFVNECRRYATDNLLAMTKWFKELGVFMDWDNPYLTLTNQYIEAAWWLIKQADQKGLLFPEYRVVYWCPRCSTTLADYEVEYRDLEDPSLYVKFPVRNEANTHLLIWTTTPWTLPANAFVMAHPHEVYLKIRVNNEYWILAEKRVDHVIRDCGIERYDVVEKFSGSELVKYTYVHPLETIIPVQSKLSRYHTIILTPDHVTMYEGTGLVHAAPGHGFEDYDVAIKSGLVETIVSPVDDEGKFISDAGVLKGMFVRDANDVIIRVLKERDALAGVGRIIHRYPVCWRCKTPVILRATRQWVIKVSKLKEDLMREALRVNWIPSWGLTRLMNILENIQDWVVSRQRYWGTPLPIWICPSGHRVVVGSIDDLVKYSGMRPVDLHRPWIDQIVFKCPECGLEMKRVPDVIDVWLDSGVAFYASRGHPEKIRENDVSVDFIVEGHDQIRGWFFSLLRSGIIGFNKSPYKVVLVHGFMLDEQGREMHKSLGNYVGTDEAIGRVGRDPLRLWLLSNTIWEDIKFSWRELEEAKRDLSILWNVAVFAKTYMDLDDYNPSRDPIEKYIDKLEQEDKWILSRLNSLIRKVEESMEGYVVFEAVREIRRFIVEDLSHWYIRLVRPRVWTEENTSEKISVYATLYYVLDRLVRLIAPITPFIAEFLYQELLSDKYGLGSIHVAEWPSIDEFFIDNKLEKYMDIVREIYSVSSSARMKAGLKLRQPIKRLLIYTDDPMVREAVEKLEKVIKFSCNAKEVKILEHGRITDITIYSVKPIYRSIGPRYRGLSKTIIEYIEKNQDKVAQDIITKGFHEAFIEGNKVEITKEDVEITPYYVKGYLVENMKYGIVALDTELTRVEIAEGIARDLIRRIQVMRKKMDLPLIAKIKTLIIAPADKLDYIKIKKDYIMNETRSIELYISANREDIGKLGGYIEEWEIDDETYTIEVACLDQ